MSGPRRRKLDRPTISRDQARRRGRQRSRWALLIALARSGRLGARAAATTPSAAGPAMARIRVHRCGRGLARNRLVPRPGALIGIEDVEVLGFYLLLVHLLDQNIARLDGVGVDIPRVDVRWDRAKLLRGDRILTAHQRDDSGTAQARSP